MRVGIGEGLCMGLAVAGLAVVWLFACLFGSLLTCSRLFVAGSMKWIVQSKA